MKNYKFVADIPTHCYQKGVAGNMLFYTQKDRLLYLTIYSTQAKKYHIKTLALNLMFNHTHSMIKANDLASLTLFNATTQQMYAREQNAYLQKEGKWFMKTFGWAQKNKAKDVRSCYCYIQNNAVEKHLYSQALDDRWNFSAYYKKSQPFSFPIRSRNSTLAFRKATHLIDQLHHKGDFLTLHQLDYFTKTLSEEDTNRLTDYIISLYCPIDFHEAENYYDSYEAMIEACKITAGSEYSLKELPEHYSDKPFLALLKEIDKQGIPASRKAFFKYNKEHTLRLACQLLQKTNAPVSMISRFLHFPIHTAPDKKELAFLSTPLI